MLAGLDEAAAAGFLEARPGPAPAWHFTHELMRRAIYDRLDAARRASLHLRVGEALEQMPTDDINRVLPELAHHFTLAVALAGADRAVAYNLRAGDAAIAAAAYDEGAARLSTALALGIADPGQRIRTQVQVAYLLRDAGRASEAEPLFDESLEAANAFGERGVAARVRLHRALTALNNMKLGAEGLQTVAEEALETFRQAGDWRGVADAGRHIAHGLRRRGRVAEAELVLEDALEAADASGDELVRRQVIGSLCFVLWAGPAPVHEAIPRCEALLEASGDRALQAAVSRSLSALCAMARRFDEAREHLGRSGPILDEVNEVANSSVYRQAAAEAKELMGDLGGAEQELKVQWLRFRDDSAFADNGLQAAHRLALMYCNDGRWADAERCLAYGRAFPEPTHFTQAHALGLAGRARVSAHRGEFAEALALARRGVEVADLSDMLNVRARVWLALADVQHAHGHPGAAEDAAATALALYEEKGNVGGAAQVRAARDARVAS